MVLVWDCWELAKHGVHRSIHEFCEHLLYDILQRRAVEVDLDICLRIQDVGVCIYKHK